MATSMTTTDRIPDIAVIIPHYNDAVRLERCLTELMQNDVGDAEILVFGMGRIGTAAYETMRWKYGDIVLGVDNDAVEVEEDGGGEGGHQRA